MLTFPATLMARPALTVEFIAQTANSADQTNYTFASQSLGAVPAAGETRHIVVIVGSYDNNTPSRDVTGVTIDIGGGEVSMTQLSYAQLGTADQSWTSGVFILALATGTTGSVRVSHDGVASECNIGVYRVMNLQSATPVDTASATTTTTVGASVGLTLDVAGGGVVFASGTSNGGWSWTNITEDYDFDAGRNHTGAHSLPEASTSLAVSGSTLGPAAGSAVSLR